MTEPTFTPQHRVFADVINGWMPGFARGLYEDACRIVGREPVPWGTFNDVNEEDREVGHQSLIALTLGQWYVEELAVGSQQPYAIHVYSEDLERHNTTYAVVSRPFGAQAEAARFVLEVMDNIRELLAA